MRSRSGTRAGLEPQTVWSTITTTVPVYEQALSHPVILFPDASDEGPEGYVCSLRGMEVYLFKQAKGHGAGIPDGMYSSEKGTSRCASETSSDHGKDVVEPAAVKPVHDVGCQEHGSTPGGQGRWRRQTALGPCTPHSATNTKQISTLTPWCFEGSM